MNPDGAATKTVLQGKSPASALPYTTALPHTTALSQTILLPQTTAFPQTTAVVMAVLALLFGPAAPAVVAHVARASITMTQRWELR